MRMMCRFVMYFQSLTIFGSICLAYNSDFVFPEQIYENSECLLNTNNESGICRKLIHCSQVLKDIENGIKPLDFQDHCSVFGSNELVCCPLQHSSASDDFSLRPDDATIDGQQIRDDLQFWGLMQNGINRNDDAAEGQFPFMASIGYYNNNNNLTNYMCGGSLISSLYILTAAHCVANTKNNTPIEVSLGCVNQHICKKNVQRISIAKLYIHPNYNFQSHYFDIALIKLVKHVEITATVKPISLYKNPISSTNAINGLLLTAGFNLKKFGMENPLKVLQSFQLKLVDKSVCERQFNGLRKLQFGLDVSMKCGKDIDETRGFDVCQGDSGGPMFLQTGNTFSLTGVISFGIGCTGIAPSVYISIYPFLDWIESHVSNI